MKNIIINILIFILAITASAIVFYFAPLSSYTLENYDFEGKISIDDAEIIVEDSGFYPLYSWYQVEHLTPYIVVMSENEEATLKDKIYVHAFNGTIDKNELEK